MDTATIILSILALLISFGSFYFQFLRKKDALICTLTGSNFDKNAAAVQLAISNIGSRPILLRDGRLKIELSNPDRTTSFYDRADHFSVPNPKLIQKGEISSVNLSLPLPAGLTEMIEQWRKNGALEKTNGYIPFYVRLIFVTGSGKLLKSQQLVQCVEYVEHGTRHIPPKKDSWRIGGPTIEDFDII